MAGSIMKAMAFKLIISVMTINIANWINIANIAYHIILPAIFIITA